MKTKTITTGRGTITLVEVQENAVDCYLSSIDRTWHIIDKYGIEPISTGIFFEYATDIIGKLSECLTNESLAERLTEKTQANPKYDIMWKNYLNKGTDFFLQDQCHTATDSLKSLLSANDVLIEKPVNPNATEILGGSPSGADYEVLDDLVDRYEKQLENYYSPNLTLVLLTEKP